MMRFFFIIILMMMVRLSNGQSLSPTVIASAGGYFSGGNAQISWTLGEPVIETVGGSSVILTQGFQQSEIVVNSIGERVLNSSVQAFPNPTNGNLTIRILEPNSERYYVEVFSIDGRLVFSSELSGISTSQQLDISMIRSGSYHFTISDRSSFSENFILIKY